MEKITFKNGQAPYINDINLNKLQDNIEKEFEIEKINVTLTDDVKSGQVCCLKYGKVVIVEVSDIVLKEDKKEWKTTIATGLPVNSSKYNAWIKGLLFKEGSGLIQIEDSGKLIICERTGIQKASSNYIGQLIYLID